MADTRPPSRPGSGTPKISTITNYPKLAEAALTLQKLFQEASAGGIVKHIQTNLFDEIHKTGSNDKKTLKIFTEFRDAPAFKNLGLSHLTSAQENAAANFEAELNAAILKLDPDEKPVFLFQVQTHQNQDQLRRPSKPNPDMLARMEGILHHEDHQSVSLNNHQKLVEVTENLIKALKKKDQRDLAVKIQKEFLVQLNATPKEMYAVLKNFVDTSIYKDNIHKNKDEIEKNSNTKSSLEKAKLKFVNEVMKHDLYKESIQTTEEISARRKS